MEEPDMNWKGYIPPSKKARSNDYNKVFGDTNQMAAIKVKCYLCDVEFENHSDFGEHRENVHLIRDITKDKSNARHKIIVEAIKNSESSENLKTQLDTEFKYFLSQWANSYDKPMPKFIFSLFLPEFCKLCIQKISQKNKLKHYAACRHTKFVEHALDFWAEQKNCIAPGKIESSFQNFKKYCDEKDLQSDQVKIEDIKIESDQLPNTSRILANNEKIVGNIIGKSAKDWTKSFDQSIPEEILSKCLPKKCELCSKVFHEKVASGHYHSKGHTMKIKIALEKWAEKKP